MFRYFWLGSRLFLEFGEILRLLFLKNCPFKTRVYTILFPSLGVPVVRQDDAESED